MRFIIPIIFAINATTSCARDFTTVLKSSTLGSAEFPESLGDQGLAREVPTWKPINKELPTWKPINKELPTWKPINKELPTWKPINKELPTWKPINKELPTWKPINTPEDAASSLHSGDEDPSIPKTTRFPPPPSHEVPTWKPINSPEDTMNTLYNGEEGPFRTTRYPPPPSHEVPTWKPINNPEENAGAPTPIPPFFPDDSTDSAVALPPRTTLMPPYKSDDEPEEGMIPRTTRLPRLL